MNKRLLELKTLAEFEGERYSLPDEFASKFSALIIQDFLNLCDQAWAFNEAQRVKEGISPAEQMVFAGAQAQCQKMKENIAELFGVTDV
jgi:hypothetical protein